MLQVLLKGTFYRHLSRQNNISFEKSKNIKSFSRDVSN